MAMIESYDFGRIVIDGRTYTRDVLIFPDRVLGSWWRKEGHSLSVEDLKEVLEFGPKTLVIGTGRSGPLKVKDETRERLESEGIEVIVESTGKACDVLNSLGPNAAGAFHLTC
ncbi:MAG: MTH938/NDUFAF3 family protein [Candidatus Hydrothermarchaeaceae archaeon]